MALDDRIRRGGQALKTGCSSFAAFGL